MDDSPLSLRNLDPKEVPCVRFSGMKARLLFPPRLRDLMKKKKSDMSILLKKLLIIKKKLNHKHEYFKFKSEAMTLCIIRYVGQHRSALRCRGGNYVHGSGGLRCRRFTYEFP